MIKKIIALLFISISFNCFAGGDGSAILETLKIEKDVSKADLAKPIDNIVELRNPSSEEISVSLKLLHPQAFETEKHDISLEQYVLGKETIYVIKPKETKRINISLKLPTDFVGSKYVFYAFENIIKKKNKGMLSFEMVTYGQLTLSVKDTIKREANLDLDVKQNKSMTAVSVSLHNVGNSYIRRISGYCIVFDNKAKKLVGRYELDSKEKTYLYQTASRKYQTIIPKALKGSFKITIVLNNNDGNFNKTESKDFIL